MQQCCSGPRFAEFFSRLVPLNWSVAGLVLHSTVETFMIALAGTFCAVVVALPLGFLAASNVTPPRSLTRRNCFSVPCARFL